MGNYRLGGVGYRLEFSIFQSTFDLHHNPS